MLILMKPVTLLCFSCYRVSFWVSVRTKRFKGLQSADTANHTRLQTDNPLSCYPSKFWPFTNTPNWLV